MGGALVTEAQFAAAQQVRAARPTGDGEDRRYLLSCGAVRGVRATSGLALGPWRAGYRCRHGRNSACPPALPQLKIVYVREDRLVRELLSRLLHD